jgi:hypothetical protein
LSKTIPPAPRIARPGQPQSTTKALQRKKPGVFATPGFFEPRPDLSGRCHKRSGYNPREFAR